MKKKLGIVGVAALIAILGLGAGMIALDDSEVEETVLTEEQKEKKEQFRTIYTTEYSQQVWSALEAEKEKQQWTADKMLIKHDPFGTNHLSLYVYFQTEQPVKVSYTVKAEGVEDFSADLYQKEEYTTEHEYQLIGLVPERENEIVLTLEQADGTKTEASTFYEMGKLLGEEEIQLEQTEKASDPKQLTNGLYTILGNDSDKLDFMYYYDNNGTIRGEIPLLGYRSHRLLFEDDLMYYSISETKMAAVNRLGMVEAVYDLGQYQLHHDYVLDDEKNLLILASNSEQDSVEDIIVQVDVESGQTTKVLDLADLFGDYKKGKTKNSDGELDWMHINTLQWLGDATVLLSSRETSTIIKISSLYSEPKVDYMIGEDRFWEGTGYEELLLTQTGEEKFSNTGGQHTVTYAEDPSLPEGEYYLYMFNNNLGVSESRTKFDWEEAIDGIQTSAKEGTTSYYYKYRINENDGTYELASSFEVPYSAYVSSVQEVEDNIIVDSGMAGLFGEYDGNGALLTQFRVEKEKFVYRVYKYPFTGFYFQ